MPACGLSEIQDDDAKDLAAAGQRQIAKSPFSRLSRLRRDRRNNLSVPGLLGFSPDRAHILHPRQSIERAPWRNRGAQLTGHGFCVSRLYCAISHMHAARPRSVVVAAISYYVAYARKRQRSYAVPIGSLSDRSSPLATLALVVAFSGTPETLEARPLAFPSARSRIPAQDRRKPRVEMRTAGRRVFLRLAVAATRLRHDLQEDTCGLRWLPSSHLYPSVTL